MKLIVKTLNGKQLPIEVDAEDTVGSIKKVIEDSHQMPADTLKLIAYGKVLDSDDKKANEYNLKEGDFIVAMVQKAKPKPKPKAAADEQKKKEEEDKPATTTANATAPATNPPAAQANPVPAQAQAPAQQPVAAPSLSPEEEAAVNELMAISAQSKELCTKAYLAADKQPDLAFEFLMSGNIPEPGPAGQDEGDDYGDEMDDGGANPMGGLAQYNLDPQTQQAIQALVNNPSFPMIRQRMLQDPNFSTQFMQQLSTTQPQIFQAIQQNPGILMSLILGHDPMAGMGGAGAGAAGAGGQRPPGQQRPPPGSIQVTPEEMQSINNLVSLGFSKARAAEAFFACDKNEEMAANFLFEQGMEDEDAAMQQAINASAQQTSSAGAGESSANANPTAATNPPAADPKPAEGGEANANAPANNEAEKKDDEKKDGDAADGGAGAGGDGGSSLV